MVEFYGVSLKSAESEAIEEMKKRGFKIENSSDAIGFTATKGKYTFNFSSDYITITVKVTNVSGIVF